MWKIPSIWDGGDVWILGGGPSVAKQFEIPEEVVVCVREKTHPPSIFSSYMKVLHDKHVIGINAAYLLGDWIDLVFFGDKSFLLLNDKGLKEFKGIKVCSHSYCQRYKGIKYVELDKNKKVGISTTPGKISWNQNSGSAAISIAVQAGAKRIFLLGFDMKRNEDSQTHWHNHYRPIQRNTKLVEHNPYLRHLKGFPAIKHDADKLGIEIYNVNPESAIDEFPKLTLKEALNA